jgi:hypothetical protein
MNKNLPKNASKKVLTNVLTIITLVSTSWKGLKMKDFSNFKI